MYWADSLHWQRDYFRLSGSYPIKNLLQLSLNIDIESFCKAHSFIFALWLLAVLTVSHFQSNALLALVLVPQFLLLVPQRAHWVGAGCPDGTIANRQQGNEQ